MKGGHPSLSYTLIPAMAALYSYSSLELVRACPQSQDMQLVKIVNISSSSKPRKKQMREGTALEKYGNQQLNSYETDTHQLFYAGYNFHNSRSDVNNVVCF